jgi:hypothetical protein
VIITRLEGMDLTKKEKDVHYNERKECVVT